MTGLVPFISVQLARLCHDYRDRRVKPGDDDVVGVMAGHSGSKNGVAEPVIGTRDFARSRWLAYVPAISIQLATPGPTHRDCRVKPGNDELKASLRAERSNPALNASGPWIASSLRFSQ
jgi:hypothetical protein